MLGGGRLVWWGRHKCVMLTRNWVSSGQYKESSLNYILYDPFPPSQSESMVLNIQICVLTLMVVGREDGVHYLYKHSPVSLRFTFFSVSVCIGLSFSPFIFELLQ